MGCFFFLVAVQILTNLYKPLSNFRQKQKVYKELILNYSMKEKELIRCFGVLAYAGVLTVQQQTDIMKQIKNKSQLEEKEKGGLKENEF